MSYDYNVPSCFQGDERLKLSSEEEDHLVVCFQDIGEWAKFAMPERFRVEYTTVHQELIDFINYLFAEQRSRQARGKRCGMKAVVIGTRGIAKTSFCQHAIPSRELVLGRCPYYAPITKSLGNTLKQSETLKNYLVNSKLFQALCNGVKPEGEGTQFSQEAWVIKVGSHRGLANPMGRGQEIRGSSFGPFGARPRLIVLDDLIDMKTEAWNPAICQDVLDYIRNDVEKAVHILEEENDPWLIFACDTQKGPNAPFEALMNDSSWEHLRISLCDKDFKTRDERFMSQESLNDEVARAREKHYMADLCRELFAECGSSEDAAFPEECMQHYKESDGIVSRTPGIINIVMVDPSNVDKQSACDTGITVWGIDMERPALYLRDAISEKMDSHGVIRAALAMVKKWKAAGLAVEPTGKGSWVEQPFKDAMTREGLYGVQLEFMSATGGTGAFSGENGRKIGAGYAFAGYYKWRVVYHNIECPTVVKYEQRLGRFPNNAVGEWDMLDSATHLPQMMKKMGMHFFEPDLEDPLKRALAGEQPHAQPRQRTVGDLVNEMFEKEMGDEFEPEELPAVYEAYDTYGNPLYEEF